MAKIFLLAIFSLALSSCLYIPTNPVFVHVINHTEESIHVTNLLISISVGGSMTTQVDKGSHVEATGTSSHRSYGTRYFYVDAEWEVK
jgi:hypothetical protein